MFCLRCGYCLVDLPSGPCPECGRVFRCADPSTFSRSARPWLRHRPFLAVQLGAAAVTLLFPILVHVTLVASRVLLGRWPHRFGMDDPKGIVGLGALYDATMASLLVSVIGAVLMLAIVCGAAAVRSWALGVKLGVMAAAAILVLVLVFTLDPAGAVVWFFD